MRKGVIRPGHVEIRVLDIDEAVKHYVDLMGLIEMDRDDKGRVYLKAWTEVDKFSVVLREADEPGMDFMGFKCVSEEVVDQLRDQLLDFGLQVEDIPAGELKDCGRRVRFRRLPAIFLSFLLLRSRPVNGKLEIVILKLGREGW